MRHLHPNHSGSILQVKKLKKHFMATKKIVLPLVMDTLKTLRNTLRFVFSFWRLRSAPTAAGCLVPIGCLVFIAGWLIVR